MVSMSSAMCFIDIGKPVVQDDDNCLANGVLDSSSEVSQDVVANGNGKVNHKRKRESQKNLSFNFSPFKHPALFVGHLSDSSVLVIEKPWWEVVQSFEAPPVHRHIYGISFCALLVYKWINEQGDRFRVSSSDTAIQLDLISKVCGVLSAEEYFLKLPDTAKDNRTYGALLNAYVQAKIKENAESLIVDMRDKGYAMHSLPFNNTKKVIEMITEMLKKNIKMDIYSYNIWVTTCGSMGSVEKIEEVLQRMKLNSSICPNWTTYSTMATMYMNMGLTEKARDCLKKVESRIKARDRIPYHYLLSLYGSLGSKEEVYRIWRTYKSNFPSIWNLGYHAMIASVVRLDDIEGAKMIFDEWLSARSTYDPRVCNLIMGSWYVKNGLLDEAEAFLENVTEVGGTVNSDTWEILAEAEGAVHWKPKPANFSTLLSICDEESDLENKEVLFEVMKQIGCLDNEASMTLVKITVMYVDDDDIESNLLLSQIQETL
ncbi:hypothetical protein MKX01_030813 [Papaver californicum]|nr:hypothetical protein MKX01_030813 [Papaver californicum]